jgi:hypothetical protein
LFRRIRTRLNPSIRVRCRTCRDGRRRASAAYRRARGGPDDTFITGSDFLIDGGVTASYFYGELGPQ